MEHRRRPRRGKLMLGENNTLGPLLDLLDMLAGRDMLPPDPNEKPLTLIDENGNWMPDIIMEEKAKKEKEKNEQKKKK